MNILGGIVRGEDDMGKYILIRMINNKVMVGYCGADRQYRKKIVVSIKKPDNNIKWYEMFILPNDEWVAAESILIDLLIEAGWLYRPQALAMI